MTQVNAPITFIVPGVRQTGASRSLETRLVGAAATATEEGQIKTRVDMAVQRGADVVRVVAVPGQDVVVLHIADGPALTLHPTTAAALMRGQSAATRSGVARAAKDGAQSAEIHVTAQLRWQGLEQAGPARTRGFFGDVLLSAFEVITGFARDKAVDFASSQAVQKLDGQVRAGVYALKPTKLEALKGSGQLLHRVPAPPDVTQQPLLVLIHGTFVDTVSTFGKLWVQHPQAVADLYAHYGGRVYALDHPTVGASPLANALTLVQSLPKGARLHLLTHSRGGLVAEVLARVCAQPGLSAADLQFFEGQAYAQQRKELTALAALVASQQISVDRVLRVACPARGTLLASGRLDAYLSVLKWTLQVAAVPVAPALLGFLNEVARRRAEPHEMPGLAAMIPDAPLLRWLNESEESIAGDLRVIAGDLEGDSIGSWLKTLLADSFYWTDNDIVVQTRSMYGGSPRLGGAQFLLDQGGKVTHFAYFNNERTVQAVVNGLTQVQPAGFAQIGPLSWAGHDSSGVRAGTAVAGNARATPDAVSDRPAVFVLPGILGSHLRAGEQRIWLSLRLIGGLSRLRYAPTTAGTPDKVQADGAIGLSYDELMAHLTVTHEVIEFSYDWRKPIEEEARRLADALTLALNARNASKQPVRLLAHSMGGLVARTLQLERPQVWDRWLQHPGARLLMLGTPNGGSWAPMQTLSGDDTFGNALASFGSPFRDRQARQWMAEMPGFIQLQAGLLDDRLGLARAATWRKLADDDLAFVQDRNWWHSSNGLATDNAYVWGVPPQAVLDQAVALRKRLDAQSRNALPGFADKLALVVGAARYTPDGYTVTAEGFVYLDAVDSGDGRVTLASALLPGVRTWALACEHGALPNERSAFAAFVELLEQGQTTRLKALPLSLSMTTSASATAGNARAASTATGAITMATTATTATTATAAVPATSDAPLHVTSRPARSRSPALPALDERSVFMRTPLGAAASVRARQNALQKPLHVTVLNGNLSHVRGPLMVGHSRSLILTGSEKAVNWLVGGGMKASLQAGLYPDEPGTQQIFLNVRVDADNPWRAPSPHAAVVVGLGDEGKLTEARLAMTVRLGVLAWAQRVAEASSDAPADIELAATLMGSGGAGMNPGNAARAIAQGVRDANRRIAGNRINSDGDGDTKRRWPLVTKLTLVELFLERASDAWHGLQVLAAAANGEFAVASTIESGIGPLRRQIDSGYRGTNYDFITATSSDDDIIAFTLDTKRARTEVRAQSTQGKLLRELVRKASQATSLRSNHAHNNLQLGRTLFQLLVPPEVEPFLSGSNRVLLELDDRTAPIPWELLDTAADIAPNPDLESKELPWAIRTQLLRKLRKESYRQQVDDARLEDGVLVVGEPHMTDVRYAALPGAHDEAVAVAQALRASAVVAPERIHALLDAPNSSQVINALFANRYRIVHIAGHGEPVKRDANDQSKIISKGGVVLSDGTFLGPDEVRAMRAMPELVFVNCCYLAKADEQEALQAKRQPAFDRAEFASGLADALIEAGVRCVIAAGWAVDDQPAAVFATTFYTQLLARQPFITAVAQAREAAWNADRNSNTWAAYQCYGDPNWTFRQGASDPFATGAPSTPRDDEFEAVSSPLGLALALEEVVVSRRHMGATAEAQLPKVQRLEERFATLWGGMGAIAEALALGYQECGDIDTAISWYERAIGCNDAGASMNAQEQLGQLRADRAWAQVRKQPADTAVLAAARADMSQALRALGLLANLQPTLKRYNLVGSAYQRMALLDRQAGDTGSEVASLEVAHGAYGQAVALALAQHHANVHEPALNALATALVLRVLSSPAQRTALDPALLETAARSLQSKINRNPDFNCHAALIEIDLLQALAAGQLAAKAAGLQQRYDALHLQVAGLAHWAQTAERADFLLRPYARAHTTSGATKQAHAALALIADLQIKAGQRMAAG